MNHARLGVWFFVFVLLFVFVTVLAVPCAYAMARFRLPFHRVIVSLLLIRTADQVWIAYAVVTAHSIVSAFFSGMFR